MSYSNRVTCVIRHFSALLILLAFVFSAVPGRAQAVQDLTGKTIILTVTSGSNPFASSGKAAIAFSNVDSSYRTYGLSATIADSAGTFQYSTSGTTNATLILDDALGVETAELAFRTSSNGVFNSTIAGSSGRQAGTFQIFDGAAPADPSGRVYDFVATVGAAPFSATGHFRMSLHNDGTYALKNLANGLATSGAFTNDQLNASTVLLDIGNSSSFGNGIAFLVFSNATGGLYMLDNGTGFQSGKSHEVLPPTITKSPTNVAVVLGKSTTMSVRASGDGPFTYQWYFNGNPITGATNSSFSLLNANGATAGGYTAVVSNDAGGTSSTQATLTIVYPPMITSPPHGVTNAIGATATFSVAADGTAPFKYQWQFNGINLAGKTTSSLTITNLKTINSGLYRVIVKNAAASVTSLAARLQVLKPVTITKAPRDYVANTNALVLLSVTPAGSAPLRYQWQYEGSDIPGATNAQYIVPGVTSSNVGTYTVIVSNTVSFTNVSAVVTVTSSPFDPNHDGQTDLLLKANDGHLITWFLSGANFLTNIVLNNGAVVDAAARVAGLSDFNNDGEKDLLLQNTNTGALTVWFMNGTNFTGTASLDSGGVIDANWKISAVADFDGDGSGDLVGQSKIDDTIAVWRMNGTTFLNTNPITIWSFDERPFHAGWFPIGTADWWGSKQELIGVANFGPKGSTAPDILTHAADGYPAIWFMQEGMFSSFSNGTNLISTNCISSGRFVIHNSTGFIAAASPAGWRAVAVADYNADGEPDVIFQKGPYLGIWYATWSLNTEMLLGNTSLRGGKPINATWRVVGPK